MRKYLFRVRRPAVSLERLEEHGGEQREHPFLGRLSSLATIAPLDHRVVATALGQGCQIAEFEPFFSLGCARMEGRGAQSKESKGSNFEV